MPVRDRRRRVRRALIALFTDVVCVIVFCTIGRRSHAEGLTVAGIAQTAWPFLAGTGVGWLLIGGWRRPFTVIPTGVVVWVCTVAAGNVFLSEAPSGVALNGLLGAPRVNAGVLPRVCGRRGPLQCGLNSTR